MGHTPPLIYPKEACQIRNCHDFTPAQIDAGACKWPHFSVIYCTRYFPRCSAVGSALGLGPRCRGFESSHLDHKETSARTSLFFGERARTYGVRMRASEAKTESEKTVLGTVFSRPRERSEGDKFLSPRPQEMSARTSLFNYSVYTILLSICHIRKYQAI